MTQEALKLALEALEEHEGNYKLGKSGCERQEKAITALKEALAEHAMREVQRLGQEIEQEPVQFKCTVIDDVHLNGIPLEQWTPPPQRKPLTPEWYADWIRNNYQDYLNIATLCDEMTKAAHGIKENT